VSAFKDGVGRTRQGGLDSICLDVQSVWFRDGRPGARHFYTYGVNSGNASPDYDEIEGMSGGSCGFISLFAGEPIDEQVSFHPGGKVVAMENKIYAERRKRGNRRSRRTIRECYIWK
jgi:hypothetical protein